MKSKKLVIVILAAIMIVLLYPFTPAFASQINKTPAYVHFVGNIIILLSTLSIVITFIASGINPKLKNKFKFVRNICIIGLIIGVTITFFSSNIAELIIDFKTRRPINM